MPINDPQAVTFSNERVRPLADILAGAIREVKVFNAYVAAKNISALFPNDPAQAVQDGSPADGRTPITGADVNAFLAAIVQLAATADANNGALQNLALKVAVNPR